MPAAKTKSTRKAKATEPPGGSTAEPLEGSDTDPAADPAGEPPEGSAADSPENSDTESLESDDDTVPTVLDALQWPCTQFDPQKTEGPNTKAQDIVEAEPWKDWEDFTFPNIYKIFESELNQEYEGPEEPWMHPEDLRIYSEACCEAATQMARTPIVNFALTSSSTKEGIPYYGSGPRCKNPDLLKPDWSCTSHAGTKNKNAKDNLVNLVTGDTKLSEKWDPTWLEKGEETNRRKAWNEPVKQVAGYMWSAKLRYGFIVTDKDLVVLRMTRLKEWEKAPAKDPTYVDKGEKRDPFYALEHKAISWTVEGEKKLTAKLALWALAKLAKIGHTLEERYGKLGRPDPRPKTLPIHTRDRRPSPGSSSQQPQSEGDAPEVHRSRARKSAAKTKARKASSKPEASEPEDDESEDSEPAEDEPEEDEPEEQRPRARKSPVKDDEAKARKASTKRKKTKSKTPSPDS